MNSNDIRIIFHVLPKKNLTFKLRKKIEVEKTTFNFLLIHKNCLFFVIGPTKLAFIWSFALIKQVEKYLNVKSLQFVTCQREIH